MYANPRVRPYDRSPRIEKEKMLQCFRCLICTYATYWVCTNVSVKEIGLRGESILTDGPKEEPNFRWKLEFPYFLPYD